MPEHKTHTVGVPMKAEQNTLFKCTLDIFIFWALGLCFIVPVCYLWIVLFVRSPLCLV